jgi:Family of unknown function (DUF5871)
MQYLNSYQVSSFTVADSIHKVNNSYVAKLDKPLLLQTAEVVLVNDIVDTQYAHLKLNKKGHAVLKALEQAIIEKAVANKKEWFGPKDLEDAFIVNNYKSYFKSRDSESVLTTRLSSETSFFDTAKKPGCPPEQFVASSQVVAVLELTHLSFGRAEFGALWRLKQLKLVEDKKKVCLIDDSLIDEEEVYGDEEAYFA